MCQNVKASATKDLPTPELSPITIDSHMFSHDHLAYHSLYKHTTRPLPRIHRTNQPHRNDQVHPLPHRQIVRPPTPN
jgi:hypothetical protein